MPSYDKTQLWQRTLAVMIDDQHRDERERLRVGYERFRERAKPVAETIVHDLPEFTVHDVSHFDALWEYAELLAGPAYRLTPCEAFVLGGAFLIHDLGMGLASYPEGVEALKALPIWQDTVAALYRRDGIAFDEALLRNPDAKRERLALVEVLRMRHAQRAEELALIYWTDATTGERFYLIEDVDLRHSFGSLIGRIAHSHWWPVEKLAPDFGGIIGAPAGFPHAWTVDPLRLACLLRAADHCHLDDRRAPSFLRAIRETLPVESDAHWRFQAKLYQPRLEGDRLTYTAKTAFSVADSSAWWVCFDTLHGIDSELRRIDSLLADTGRDRLAAKAVSQCEEPSRLAQLIRTSGWEPVDTRIRVSAVADLVSKLGGRELYGNRIEPPLRELIQNAADAVRARRVMDGKEASWGEIRVSIGTDDLGSWLQVEDSGVGMSERVLTGPFLDFGTSFWGSALMHEEFPGLEAKGFRAAGQYGIGFFSVFMWGDRVQITTRRFEKARSDTRILQFAKGLTERPLLRHGELGEQLTDGGTRVRVWLRDPTILKQLLSDDAENDEKLTLAEVCAHVAPCLDVSLEALDSNEWRSAIVANDWLTLDDVACRKRLGRRYGIPKQAADSSPPPLSVIRDLSGRVFGRAALWYPERYRYHGSASAVCVGGLRACGLSGIEGVLIGKAGRAARDTAVPLVPPSVINQWLIEERDRRLSEGHSFEDLEGVARILCRFGIELASLPVAFTNMGWLDREQIAQVANQLDEAILVQNAAVSRVGGRSASLTLHEGVFSVEMGSVTVLQPGFRNWADSWLRWPATPVRSEWGEKHFHADTLEGAVIESLALGWDASISDVLAASSMSSDEASVEREIGTIGDTPVIEHVDVIRRPH